MLTLERGIDCCGSWGSFTDRAKVMAVAASVRARTTGDSLFFLFVPSSGPTHINMVLLVGGHPCRQEYINNVPHIPQTINSALIRDYVWVKVDPYFADEQCLQLAARLSLNSYFSTSSIVAHYRSHHHHPCVYAYGWHVQSDHSTKNCVFLGLYQK